MGGRTNGRTLYKTEEDLERYIRMYEEREGIRFDP
jgi:hypothetical protein